MSTLTADVMERKVKEGDFTIQYCLTHSRNDCFEEYELWEYGIKCSLYKQSEFISSECVSHISSNLDDVLTLLHIVERNKVFPVHLLDVVADYLSETLSVF